MEVMLFIEINFVIKESESKVCMYLAPPFRPMVVNKRNCCSCFTSLSVVPADPKLDVKIKLEGWDVVVPQGTPIQVPKYSSSCFSQSEYLVYRESQARIRYLLKLKF